MDLGRGATYPSDAPWDDYAGIDPDQIWESVLGGTWAPYRMCANSTTSIAVNTEPPIMAPAFTKAGMSIGGSLGVDLRSLASVDVVITSDKTKWTRCPVLEEHISAAGTFPANIEKIIYERVVFCR